MKQGQSVAWQGSDSRLHLGVIDEITGKRAVVTEMAHARRGGKLTTKVIRWSVTLSELQPQ